MEVIIGTYNHVVFGFSFHLEEKNENKNWQFGPLFTDQGHAGCIKTVASNGRYLSSGSTDETIRLFDLKKHVEVGTLMEQSGSITCLLFCGTTHMLSGSEDGTICIWKSKSWELLKKLKGHRGAINSLSLHPSGRLALSISKDKCIRTWNLLTGRTAYTTNLKEVGELIRWSPKGDCYAIVVGCKVTFYQISGADDPIVYQCEKYILVFEFISDYEVVLAGEIDDIIFYNFKKKIVLQRLAAHKVRTKGLCLTDNPYAANELLMFTTSSDGNLKAWSVNKTNLEKDADLLAELDMPGRPTCMTLKVPREFKEIAKTNKEAAKEEIEEKDEDDVDIEMDEDEKEELVNEKSEEEAGQESENVEKEKDPPKVERKKMKARKKNIIGKANATSHVQKVKKKKKKTVAD